MTPSCAARRLLAATVITLAPLATHAQKMKLTWSDEFKGARNTAPNPANWTYDTGAGGYGNGELQFYCKPFAAAAPCDPDHSNIFLDGHGKLIIRATLKDGTWTSGRLKSEGKQSLLYGRTEARMKLPVGAGLWPAFWMLGADIATSPWPASGEQDIMEWVQSYGPTTTSAHIHGPGYSAGKALGKDFTFPQNGRTDDNKFHVYGETWSPGRIEFYRDDPKKPFLVLTPKDLPPGATWAFDHPFFVLLNFAIGSGGFPGKTDASTPSEAQVEVDWVRHYEPAR